jgi:hypothetical protein
MVAKLSNLRFFLLVFLGVTAFACASEPVEDKQILNLATEKLSAATTALGEKIEACEANSVKLTPDMFSEVEIPDKQLMIALLYLSDRQREKCEGEAWRDFVYQLHVYKSVVDHLDVKEDISLDYQQALHSNKWRWLKLELQYQELKPGYRDTLEAMPALNQPFDPAPVIDTLGKSDHSDANN